MSAFKCSVVKILQHTIHFEVLKKNHYVSLNEYHVINPQQKEHKNAKKQARELGL